MADRKKIEAGRVKLAAYRRKKGSASEPKTEKVPKRDNDSPVSEVATSSSTSMSTTDGSYLTVSTASFDVTLQGPKSPDGGSTSDGTYVTATNESMDMTLNDNNDTNRLAVRVKELQEIVAGKDAAMAALREQLVTATSNEDSTTVVNPEYSLEADYKRNLEKYQNRLEEFNVAIGQRDDLIRQLSERLKAERTEHEAKELRLAEDVALLQRQLHATTQLVQGHTWDTGINPTDYLKLQNKMLALEAAIENHKVEVNGLQAVIRSKDAELLNKSDELAKNKTNAAKEVQELMRQVEELNQRNSPRPTTNNLSLDDSALYRLEEDFGLQLINIKDELRKQLNTEHSSELTSLQRQLESLKQQCDDARCIEDKLTSELASYQVELALASDQIANLNARLNEKESDLNAMRHQVEKTKKDSIKFHENEVMELRDRNEGLEVQVEKMQAELDACKEAFIAQWGADKQKKESELVQLRLEVAELKEASRLETTLEQEQQMLHEKKLDSLNESVQQLTEEVASTKSQFAETVTKYQEERTKYEHQIEELLQQNASLESKSDLMLMEKVKELKNEIEQKFEPHLEKCNSMMQRLHNTLKKNLSLRGVNDSSEDVKVCYSLDDQEEHPSTAKLEDSTQEIRLNNIRASVVKMYSMMCEMQDALLTQQELDQSSKSLNETVAEEFETRLTEQRTEISRRKEQLEGIRQDFDILKARHIELQDGINSANQECEDWKRACKEKTEQEKVLNKRIAELEAAMSEANENTKALSQSVEEEAVLLKQIAELQAALSDAHKETGSWKHACEQKQEKEIALLKKIADMEFLLSEIDKKSEVLKTKQEEGTVLLKKIVDLENALTNVNKDAETLRITCEQKEEKEASLLQQIVDLEANLTHVNKDAEALKYTCEQQEEKEASLLQQISALEAALTDVNKDAEALKNTCEQQEEKEASLLQQIANLEAALTDVNKEAETLKNTCEQKEQKEASLLQQIAYLEAALTDVNKEAEILKNTCEQKEQREASLLQQIANLEAVLGDADKESATLRQKQDEEAVLLQRIADLEAKCTEANKQAAALRQACEEQCTTEANLHSRIAELEAAMKEVMDDSLQMKADSECMTKQVAKAKELLRRMKVERDELISSCRQHETEVATLRAQLAEAQVSNKAQLERLSTQLSKFERDHDELSERCQIYEAEVNKLRGQLAISESSLEDLRNQSPRDTAQIEPVVVPKRNFASGDSPSLFDGTLFFNSINNNSTFNGSEYLSVYGNSADKPVTSSSEMEARLEQLHSLLIQKEQNEKEWKEIKMKLEEKLQEKEQIEKELKSKQLTLEETIKSLQERRETNSLTDLELGLTDLRNQLAASEKTRSEYELTMSTMGAELRVCQEENERLRRALEVATREEGFEEMVLEVESRAKEAAVLSDLLRDAEEREKRLAARLAAAEAELERAWLGQCQDEAQIQQYPSSKSIELANGDEASLELRRATLRSRAKQVERAMLTSQSDGDDVEQSSDERWRRLREHLETAHRATVMRLKHRATKSLTMRDAELRAQYATQLAEANKMHLEKLETMEKEAEELATRSQQPGSKFVDMKADLDEIKLKLDESQKEVYTMLELKFRQLVDQEIAAALNRIQSEHELLEARKVAVQEQELLTLQARLEEERQSEVLRVKQELLQMHKDDVKQLKRIHESEMSLAKHCPTDSHAAATLLKEIICREFAASIKGLSEARQLKFQQELSELQARLDAAVDPQDIEPLLDSGETLVDQAQALLQGVVKQHANMTEALGEYLDGGQTHLLEFLDTAVQETAAAVGVANLTDRVAQLEQEKQDLLQAHKVESEASMSRMQQLLGTECGACIFIRQELEARHKKEVEELRQYFEQKCADVEKHYSEEIFSQHSRKLSASSSSCDELVPDLCYTGAAASEPTAKASDDQSLESRMGEYRDQLEAVKLELGESYRLQLATVRADYEARVEELVRELTADRQKLEDERHASAMRELEVKHEEQVNNLQSELEQSEHDLNELRGQVDGMKEEFETKHMKDLENLREQLENKHATKLEQVKAEFESKNQKDLANLREKLEKEAEQVKADYDAKLSKSADNLQEQLMIEKENHARELSELKASYEQRLSSDVERIVTTEMERDEARGELAAYEPQAQALRDEVQRLQVQAETYTRELETERKALSEQIEEFTMMLKLGAEQEQDKYMKVQKEMMASLLLQHQDEMRTTTEKYEARLRFAQQEILKLNAERVEYEELMSQNRRHIYAEVQHDVIQALDEQIRALLSEGDASACPAELQLLQDRLTGRYKDELASLRQELLESKQTAVASEENKARDDDRRKPDYRHMAATLKQLVRELATYVSVCEDELNNTLVRRILTDDDDNASEESGSVCEPSEMRDSSAAGLPYLSIASDLELTERGDDTTVGDASLTPVEVSMSVATPVMRPLERKVRRVHFAPDISSVLDLDRDDGPEASATFRHELDACLDRLRAEAAEITRRAARQVAEQPESSVCRLNEELSAARQRIAHLESREDVTEGYGQQDRSSVDQRVETIAELQEQARAAMSEGQVDSAHLKLMEALCRESDRLVEDAKLEREDLQQQVCLDTLPSSVVDSVCRRKVEAADKKLRSTRHFLEEQAAEREQERDDFQAEISRLQELLRSGDVHRGDAQRLAREVESLESQVKEANTLLRESEEKKDELEAEHKAAVEMVWLLRGIITKLEAQVETKSGSETELEARVADLEAELQRQIQTNQELGHQLECSQGDTAAHIAQLEEELRVHRLHMEQMQPDSAVVSQMRSTLLECETTIDKKTRDLESLYLAVSSTASSPTVSEDVSIKDQVDRMRSSTPDPAPGALPLNQLLRLQDKLQLHSRAEQAALKRVRDLEMQVKAVAANKQEISDERDVLQGQVEEQLLRISQLQANVEEQRSKADDLIQQASSELHRRLHDRDIEARDLREAVENKDIQMKTLQDQLEQTRQAAIAQEAEWMARVKSEQDHVQKIKKEYKKLKDKKKEQNMQQAEDEARKKGVEAENNAAAKEQDTVNDNDFVPLSGVLTAMQSTETAAVAKKITELERQVESLERELERERSGKDDTLVDRMVRSMSALRLELDQKDNLIAELQAQLSELPNLEAEIAALKDRLKKTIVSVAQDQGQAHDQLRKVSASEARLKDDVNSLQADLDKERRISETLRGDLERVEGEMSALRDQVAVSEKIAASQSHDELDTYKVIEKALMQGIQSLSFIELYQLHKCVRDESNRHLLQEPESLGPQPSVNPQPVDFDTIINKWQQEGVESLTRDELAAFNIWIKQEVGKMLVAQPGLLVDEVPMMGHERPTKPQMHETRTDDPKSSVSAMEGIMWQEQLRAEETIQKLTQQVEQLQAQLHRAQSKEDKDRYSAAEAENNLLMMKTMEEELQTERKKNDKLKYLVHVERKHLQEANLSNADLTKNMRLRLEAAMVRETEQSMRITELEAILRKVAPTNQPPTRLQPAPGPSASQPVASSEETESSARMQLELKELREQMDDMQLELTQQKRLAQRYDTEREKKRELRSRVDALVAEKESVTAQLDLAQEKINKQQVDLENQEQKIKFLEKLVQTREQNLEQEKEKNRHAAEISLTKKVELNQKVYDLEQEVVALKRQNILESSKPKFQPADTKKLIDKLKAMDDILTTHMKENKELHEKLAKAEFERNQFRDRVLHLEESLDNRERREMDVVNAIMSAERANWSREKADLLNTLAQSEANYRVNEQVVNVEQSRHVFGKYLREESYRKALVWQKRYLMVVIEGHQQTEKHILDKLARVGGAPASNAVCSRGVDKFRSCAMAIIAVHRMKFLVARWRRRRHLGSNTVLLTGAATNNINDPVPVNSQRHNSWMGPRSSTRIPDVSAGPDVPIEDFLARFDSLQQMLGLGTDSALPVQPVTPILAHKTNGRLSRP